MATVGLVVAALALSIGLGVIAGQRSSSQPPPRHAPTSRHDPTAPASSAKSTSTGATSSVALVAAQRAPLERAAGARANASLATAHEAPRLAREKEEREGPAGLRGRGLPFHALLPCADASKGSERTSYLSHFRPPFVSQPKLLAHPSAATEGLKVIEAASARLRQRALQVLGLDAELPIIVAYPSLEALREHSCTSQTALAYYDGVIHVAAPPQPPASERLRRLTYARELEKSLQHEFAHHVLVSHGVGAPLWLQEGSALLLSRDEPRGYYAIWRTHPIDLARMVDLPRQTSPEAMNIFDAQAYVMVQLLERLCLARERCNVAELVTALTSGATTPDALFEWAVSRRSDDLLRASRLGVWLDYAEHGNFPPATLQALLARSSALP